MTQYELHKIKQASYKPSAGIALSGSSYRQHRDKCDLHTVIYFDPSIPDLDGFLVQV